MSLRRDQVECPYLESQDMRTAVITLAKKERYMLPLKLLANVKHEVLGEKKAKKPRLTDDDVAFAENKANEQVKKHLGVLSVLRKALARTRATIFDDDLAEAVMNLHVAYPCLKWQLKVILHSHFLAHSAWDIERILHGHRWFGVADGVGHMAATPQRHSH